MSFFVPRGYRVRCRAISDYPGVAALVCVHRRVFILNTAARANAKIIQLYCGQPDPAD